MFVPCVVGMGSSNWESPESLVEGQEFSNTTGIQREGSAEGSQGLTDPGRPLS
ncbi:MAG: hypothetical protein QOE55_5476, partial [Acidobacteriaceae bacterium]|nr:hypothetical protein [Acidobacteriaceae bacterium]